MEKQAGRILLSVFLIGIGVVALLGNLNMLPFDLYNDETLIAAVFGVVGLGFVLTFLLSIHSNWWAIIPGMTMLGLAGLIGIPYFQGELGGSLFLGCIGLSFWVIFLTSPREHWWAIIPGGVLATLAGWPISR